jgi:hypothetical protein
MNESSKYQSQKTLNRIETIRAEINAHKDNIKLLNEWANKYSQHKYCYSPRSIRYTCIPRSEIRYRWTLNNLLKQVSLLERELDVLIEYGI